jgi:hypothetical protein
VIAFVIRTAVPDLIAHRANSGQLGIPLQQQLSGNATHVFRLSQFGTRTNRA